jgi:hypothetical protein
VKRTGRDEPFGVVIHICMEITQGITLCSYLYLKLSKCHVSPFIFYVFSSTKSKNRRVEKVLPGWEGGGGGETCRRINVVQIQCTHVCKCKTDTC